MNPSEINVTPLIHSAHFVPFDLSNNRATLGDNAGTLTWNASKQAAQTIPSPLALPEQKDAFRDFVRSSGGWDAEEIAAWSDTELDALFMEWVAGDIREAFGDADPEDWDWKEYEEDAKAGRIAARLFKAKDGEIYFSIDS
jgi:hypothetical protein